MLLFAATALFAQDKVRIEFEGEGSREVWIQVKGKEGELPERTSVSGKAVEIDVPEKTADKIVFVHDTETGNVALRPLDDVIEAGGWTVKPEDATHTFTVAFLVEHEGDPVSTAVVKITCKGEEREELVTDNDEGLAAFHVVPFGDVEVSVDYESEGQDATTSPQTFEAKSGMASEAPFVLTISDTVDTIQPPVKEEGNKDAAPTKGEEEEKKDEPVKTNPFLTFFNMLIGLLVIGGISYGIWRYVKANPEKTADALGKAGVPMPGDPGGATQTHTPKKAGPPQQIILDNAAPTPSDAPVAVAAAAPMAKNPRLVKADGSLFLVQEGDQTVGRDQAAGLPLETESSVSRTHAKLSRAGDSVTIEDTGSTNGTFVNGQKITGPTALRPGDNVQFGAVQFRFEE